MNTPVSEDKYVEFKSSFNDAVIESLTAFANTLGGKVYVGLSSRAYSSWARNKRVSATFKEAHL